MKGKRDEGDVRAVEQRERKIRGRSRRLKGLQQRIQNRKGFQKDKTKVREKSHTKGGRVATPKVAEQPPRRAAGETPATQKRAVEMRENLERRRSLSL